MLLTIQAPRHIPYTLSNLQALAKLALTNALVKTAELKAKNNNKLSFPVIYFCPLTDHDLGYVFAEPTRSSATVIQTYGVHN